MSIRLLNVHSFELEEFSGASTPEYVIASHRWEQDECTYQDVLSKRNTHKAGYKKVEAFCAFVRQLRGPNLKCSYIWIDTCCIDKTSSQEVSESINSMYKWYSESICCYAYLSDLEPIDEDANRRHATRESFYRSKWFTRGWTLQELLAPQTVVFLTRQWQVYGHKCTRTRPGAAQLSHCPGAGNNLNASISEITTIPQAVLFDFASSRKLNVKERMAWMRTRETTKGEDMAYSLLGIFNVNMIPNYGEGKERAKRRLKEQIEIEKSHRERRRRDSSVTRPRPSPCTASLLDSERPPLFSRTNTDYSLGADSIAQDRPSFQATVESGDEGADGVSPKTAATPAEDIDPEFRVKKGRTRLPRRLVRPEALRDLEYVYTEEEYFYIVPLALGKAHIDELLRATESYNNMKPISYKLKSGDGYTDVEADTRKLSPSRGHHFPHRRANSTSRSTHGGLKPPQPSRPRSSSTPKPASEHIPSRSAPPTINTHVDTAANSTTNCSGIGPQDPRRYTLPKSPVQGGTMRMHFQYAARPSAYLISSLKMDVGNHGLNPEDVQERTKDSYERTFYEIEVIAPYNQLSHRSWDELIDQLKEYYVYPKELHAIGYKHQASFD